MNDITKPFDAAKSLSQPEDLIELLNEAFDSGRAGFIAAALGVAARSEGMSKIAAETGANRQALYAALSEDGNPTLETMLKVMGALGIRLKCESDVAAAA